MVSDSLCQLILDWNPRVGSSVFVQIPGKAHKEEGALQIVKGPHFDELPGQNQSSE